MFRLAYKFCTVFTHSTDCFSYPSWYTPDLILLILRLLKSISNRYTPFQTPTHIQKGCGHNIMFQSTCIIVQPINHLYWVHIAYFTLPIISTPSGKRVLCFFVVASLPSVKLLLLLLLSRFSRVRLCATPRTVAYQAPLSMGFSRQ